MLHPHSIQETQVTELAAVGGTDLSQLFVDEQVPGCQLAPQASPTSRGKIVRESSILSACFAVGSFVSSGLA